MLYVRRTMGNQGMTDEQYAARLYAHMEDVRRRNEETSKRRRNYGYAD